MQSPSEPRIGIYRCICHLDPTTGLVIFDGPLELAGHAFEHQLEEAMQAIIAQNPQAYTRLTLLAFDPGATMFRRYAPAVQLTRELMGPEEAQAAQGGQGPRGFGR